jgi:hypothetical protein
MTQATTLFRGYDNILDNARIRYAPVGRNGCSVEMESFEQIQAAVKCGLQYGGRTVTRDANM